MGCTAPSADERLDCLRSRALQQLQNASEAVTAPAGQYVWDSSFSWDAAVDGEELIDHPFTLVSRGRLHHVPLLAGVNSDEGTSLVYPGLPRPLNASAFNLTLSSLASKLGIVAPIEAALAFYPPDASEGAENAPLLTLTLTLNLTLTLTPTPRKVQTTRRSRRGSSAISSSTVALATSLAG